MFGSFGFGAEAIYRSLRDQGEKAGKPIKVTAEKFEKILKKQGLSDPKVQLHTRIAKVLGEDGSSLIAGKKYTIKEEKNNDKQAKKRSKKASQKSNKNAQKKARTNEKNESKNKSKTRKK